MTKYVVAIIEYAVLRTHDHLSTFIIESDKTAEELKQEIIKHNKKRKDNKVLNVSVSEVFGGNACIKQGSSAGRGIK